MTLTAPEKLGPQHELSEFDCSEPALNVWLQRRAMPNQESGASRTYVICDGTKVVGFYALAVGALAHEIAPGKMKRNMPDPIPVMILARLAVDHRYQGLKLATVMLRDAVIRTLHVAEIAGIRAILVHAVSEEAKGFYERYGFHQSPVDPLTLMITLREAQLVLVQELK